MTTQATLTPAQVAQSIRNPMFAKRDTLEDAYDYFFSVVQAINAADRTAAITATQVLLNTIADQIERVEA
jgi:uncharacterized protein (DUF2267 family)